MFDRSDLLILKTIKQAVEMRNSVCHSATICSNAIMHAGTTVDTFLRENLVNLSSYRLSCLYALFFFCLQCLILVIVFTGVVKQGN